MHIPAAEAYGEHGREDLVQTLPIAQLPGAENLVAKAMKVTLGSPARLRPSPRSWPMIEDARDHHALT